MRGNLYKSIFLLCILMLALNLRGDEKGTVRNIDLITGNINYRIALGIFNKDGKEYISGIGLLGSSDGRTYSKRGWSAQGFIQLKMNGENLFKYPVEIKSDVKTCEMNFNTPEGKSSITFRTEEQGNRLLTTIHMPGKGKLETTLIAYPGEFNKQNLSLNQRHVATAMRDLAFPSEEKIGKEEAWIYFYDGKNNPQGNPYKSTCAVLYNPNETEQVGVKGENYAVRTTLVHKEGLKEVHYIFWEFPGRDHFKALEYMKNLKIEYMKSL
ncbi:MAG: hypothetical protein A2017_15125 [Lentisphaerae bacterium GWF2_44_16]|nr:MAG: hypothetical protein A2017_15125 [Lentisphaerae bacterium GWF2_44_16]